MMRAPSFATRAPSFATRAAGARGVTLSALLALHGGAALPAAVAHGPGVRTQGAPPTAPNAPNAPVAPNAPEFPDAARLLPPLRTLREHALLTPPGPTLSPTFGSVVAFAGDHAVVSGPIVGRVGFDEGQIVVFQREGDAWAPSGPMVVMSGIEPGDVALRWIAGAPSLIVTEHSRGREGRAELASFHPSGAGRPWQSGFTVSQDPPREQLAGAVSTCAAFIAAATVDTSFRAAESGPRESPSVKIFRWKAPSVEPDASIRPASTHAAPWFGASIALDGDTLAIGSPLALPGVDQALDLDGPDARASVFIHRREGESWRLEQEIDGREATPWPGFGATIALEGDLLAIRATGDDEQGPVSKVLVYRRNAGRWQQDGELEARGVISSGSFGAALAVSRGRILVGDSHAIAPNLEPTGLVHGFERVDGRWIETMRLVPRQPSMLRSFGSQIAVRDDLVLVNRTRSAARGCEFGGAYLFVLPVPGESGAPLAVPTPAP